MENIVKRVIQLDNIYRDMNRKLSSDLESFLERDITINQYFLLQEIIQSGGSCCPTELAHSRGVDRSAITSMLNKLESKHYIRRVRVRQDRRTIRVELVEGIKEKMKKGQLIINESNRLYAEHLNDEEWEKLLEILLKLAK